MRYAVRATFFAGLTAFAVGNAAVDSLHFPVLVSNSSNSRVAVPFGSLGNYQFSEPSLVQTADTNFDINVVASDELWEKYRRKGLWYSCLLDMTIEAAGRNLGDTRQPPSAESHYQGDFQAEMRGWGWIEATVEYDSNCDFRDDPDVSYNSKIGTALTDLGLSLMPVAKGGDNECFSIEHGDDYGENGDFYERHGKELPYTGAHYAFAINKKDGAIFAQNLLSPSGAMKRDFEEDEISPSDLPDLARCSDIIWSYWLRDNQNPRDLDYLFGNHIRNEDTLALISRVLRNHDMNEVPRWPGLRLEMSTNDALAILGSPIGSIIAHLLFQHKGVLGIKNLEYITIFRDNHSPNNAAAKLPEVQLLFVTLDSPNDETTNEDVEMPDAPDAKMKRDVRVQQVDAANVIREHRVAVKLHEI